MSRYRALGAALLVYLAAASAMAAPEAEPAGAEAALNEVPGTGDLMPLRFATSGNFQYVIDEDGPNDFRVATLQLDLSLTLSRYVDVSAGLAYDGVQESFGVGSFAIDCGLAGDGERYLLQSTSIERSGVVFGKFDVPFGIAYLEYSPVDNRLVTQPGAVLATHGGWSDVGAQLYVAAAYVNFIGYLVNGEGAGTAQGSGGRPDDAVGARFGLLPFEPLEIGVSAAALERERNLTATFVGGDLTASPGNFDLRLEYIGRFLDGSDAGRTHGAYARALYRLDRVFVTGRYGLVVESDRTRQRELAAGLGFEVFPQGEIRVVHQRDFDGLSALTFFEIVGGSTWQPTGFRR